MVSRAKRTLSDTKGGEEPLRGTPRDPAVEQKTPEAEGGDLPRFGPVERKVRGDVAALVSTHPMGEALAEMAYTLARTLDDGAGLAVAAVNRELRANLIELASQGVSDDDDFEDQLSSPVRDPEDT